MSHLIRQKIHINGIVQGVGFRPFVYNFARKLGLGGWVCNSSSGVLLEIEGTEESCTAFIDKLRKEPPSLAEIVTIDIENIAPCGETDFVIRPSIVQTGRTLIPVDMGTCDECKEEILDAANRRFGYALTNCTNCGPRFTIIKDLPYDREKTTMAAFPMCHKCTAEFIDPANRRFHAQPNACKYCGPALKLEDMQGNIILADPIDGAKQAIKDGKILAVKGIGGYHLVCDATNQQVVTTLRCRKQRWDKPFAIMLPDIQTVHKYCCCSGDEEKLLNSQRRPILLLRKNENACLLPEELAPNNSRLGVMLPYTPLHYLLIKDFDALVMTSANISDEPIVYRDEDVFGRLSGLADMCLSHDREIYRRCDDSVMAYLPQEKKAIFVRRSRGFVPEPISIKGCDTNILAIGAQQKNTFCLIRGDEAFLSQHIGELDNMATYEEYSSQIDDLEHMLGTKPQLLAGDMHPQYMSTSYAKSRNIMFLPVQHHHAHFASVLAEHSIEDAAIGLIYDGTGYGEDGHMWGGEILVGDIAQYKRAAHLRYAPMPGGEKAILEPWRMALGFLLDIYEPGDLEKFAPKDILKQDWQILVHSVQMGINAPLTSGIGRLFDAVAALCGIGHTVNYQGQAAIELEQAVDIKENGSYHWHIDPSEQEYILDWQPVIIRLLEDIHQNIPVAKIAARFHNSIINMSADICGKIRQDTDINIVALSGGCWNNMLLIEGVCKRLKENGFDVFFNEKVPVNDGGISFGQGAVAAAKVRKGEIYVPGDSR